MKKQIQQDLFEGLDLTPFNAEKAEEEDKFFIKQSPSSKVKSQIVHEYFLGWASIIGRSAQKLSYIDLLCGPGKYKDGNLSTPLMIISSILDSNKINYRVQTIFNDENPELIKQLKENIAALPRIQFLKHEPQYFNDDITEIKDEAFRNLQSTPALIFIDPFGYKPITRTILGEAIKHWGCDCIFFFNYSRINSAFTNRALYKNLFYLFGEERTMKLKAFFASPGKPLSPKERESIIMNELKDSLKQVRGQYSITFKFYQTGKKKTSHFIVLVTKHPTAYHLMKEIMAKHSRTIDSVPTYEFVPGAVDVNTANLFDTWDHPIQKLKEQLINNNRGTSKNVAELFFKESINTPYIRSNFITALLQLEAEAQIEVIRPPTKRRSLGARRTMPDNAVIRFK